MPRGRPSRQQVFESLDQAANDLRVIGGLPEPTVFQDVWANIWTEETHHSTAMEGNTLRLRQVQLLLEDGVVTGSQNELREWLEAKAYSDAARWVYHHAYFGRFDRSEARITESDIRRIHDLVVRSVWAHFPPEGLVRGEEPGAYRLKDHDPLRLGLQPLASSLIRAQMANWVASANDEPDQLNCHLIERLAELHAALERIHPFPDGNGRVGRLVLSLLLVRHGYPPAVIQKTDRQRYLRSLERADEGDAGPLGELLARAVKDGIYKFLMPKLAGPLSVVPLAGLADDELSHYALVAAAQRGRLKANKHGRTWYSTPQWVREYKASRYSRRRPRTTGTD
jgi:cell filamentation protein, protein adenylyltransferase